MPVDPSISLSASATGGAQAGGNLLAGGGLDTIAKFAGIQNALNQNRLFQQTFEARQGMGQIMSTANSPEEGLDTIMKSRFAPFGVEFANTARQMLNTQADIATKKQAGYQSGASFVLHQMAAGINDPSTLGDRMNAALSTVDPMFRPGVQKYADSLVKSLTDGLPTGSDPASVDARNKLYTTRMIGNLTAANYTPESMHELTGTREMPNVGGQIIPGVQLPAGQGGAFVPSGNALATSPVPRVSVEPLYPGGAPGPVQLGGQGGLGGIGAPGVPPPSTATSFPAAAAPSSPASILDSLGISVPTRPTTSAPGLGLPLEAQKQIEQRQGKMGDYEAKLDTDVNTSNIFAKNMQEMADMAKTVTLGGGAENYKRLGQALQAFGVKNDTVDKWANGSLAASQVVDKVSLDNVMLRAKQMLEGIGGSRFNMQEFVQLLEKNPNITTDPRAIQEIFGLWNKYNSRYQTEQKALDAYKQLGGDIGRWPAVWQGSKFMKDFTPTEIDMEGMRGTTGVGVKGGSRPPIESFFR